MSDCGPLFRDQPIEWSNGSSRVTVDRPWRKPCCALSNKGQRNTLKCLNKYLSNSLDTTSSFSPFLWTGTTRPSFHSVSSLPSVRDKLKRAQGEGVTSLAHSLARLWEERQGPELCSGLNSRAPYRPHLRTALSCEWRASSRRVA